MKTRPLALMLAMLGMGSDVSAQSTLIVLDASGSMWGQIDGRPKLEIARETLATALGTMSADEEIGLLAYGHRRKGDCADIELIVPPAVGSADTINAAVAQMKFLGMTPLTDAVREAARSLRYTEQAARVILITDGVETCKADPCALGAELANSGVDFTAHVVGFGLSAEEGRQVACLAENTGGRYLQADDMEGLAAALEQTMVSVPEPPPLPEASLKAPQNAAIASTIDVEWEGPDGRGDDVQVFDPAANEGVGRVIRSQRLNQDRGYVERKVSLTMPAEPGAYELRYWHGERRRVLARVDIDVVLAEVRLDAPDQVSIGTTVQISWHGPGAGGDDVQLVQVASGEVVRSQRLNQDRGFSRQVASLQAPTVPGHYVLRYWNGKNRQVLAERPIEVVDAEVSLTAPEQADMGRPIVVTWTGPGAGSDDLHIARVGESSRIYSQRLNQDRGFASQQATINAPIVPGEYELRYWSGADRRVLATRPIQIVVVPVALEAPARVAAGSQFVVRWQGPGASSDDVNLVQADGGKKVRSYRLNQDRGFGRNEVTLKAPEAAGNYLLRYVNNHSRTVLTERPIRVE